MLRDIRKALSPVRSRLRMMRTLNWCLRGAVVGGCVGIAMEMSRLLAIDLPTWASWSAMAGGAALGALAGLCSPISSLLVARLIDRHYKLQDRSVTALAFAKRENPDAVMQLQMSDALDRIGQTVPRDVLPLGVPRSSVVFAFTAAIMLGLVLIPRGAAEESADANLLQQVVADQAKTLEETMLEDVREMADKQQDPELDKLLKELEEQVEELKAPEVDQREALAKLSEMQAALASAMEKLDLQKVDAQLQELAEAMQPAESLQSVSESLKNGKYDKAAEQLEKVDLSKLNRKERDAVNSNLKKLNKKLEGGEPGELSDGVKEMQEGLEEENESKCKNGQCKAASACKKQGVKKSIKECLSCQLNRLSECKCNCQNPSDKVCNNVAKSKEPSAKAGAGASNEPTGLEKTQLDSNRQRDNITGVQGDGPSERETSNAPEGEQKAARSYSERYTEFRKQMEEVLDNEPLPLGHRETVRKYFESIRPSNEEDK